MMTVAVTRLQPGVGPPGGPGPVRELRLNFRYFRHVTGMVAEAEATGSIACTQSDDLIITRSPVARGLAG